jgi:hypothetical protein
MSLQLSDTQVGQFSQIDVKVHNTTAAGLVLRMQGRHRDAGRFLLRAHRYQDRTISTEHSACPRMGWLRGPMRLTT